MLHHLVSRVTAGGVLSHGLRLSVLVLIRFNVYFCLHESFSRISKNVLVIVFTFISFIFK